MRMKRKFCPSGPVVVIDVWPKVFAVEKIYMGLALREKKEEYQKYIQYIF